jgi:hypothetical protein
MMPNILDEMKDCCKTDLPPYIYRTGGKCYLVVIRYGKVTLMKISRKVADELIIAGFSCDA